MKERVLVVGAHALDFLWRCGGTIAQYVQNGHEVQIVNLTYGSRGESNDIWKKKPDITEDEVIKIRKKESMDAAAILGAKISFMGWQDHMLQDSLERELELAKIMKEFQPTIILTHFSQDTLNPDHATTSMLVTKAFRLAKSSGVLTDKKAVSGVKMFMFEPSHPELFGYVPDTFINISDVMEHKIKAMQLAAAQEYLIQPYINRAKYRGQAAGRVAGAKGEVFAETFRRCAPFVGKFFT